MTPRPLRPSHDPRSISGTSAEVNTMDAPVRPTLGKRLTCLQCRHRKVRCDGRQGVICRNCNRLGFGCSFERIPGQFPDHATLKLPESRRRTQACISCHSRKTRCDGGVPSCANCLRRGGDCTYPAGRNRASIKSASNSDGGATVDPMCRARSRSRSRPSVSAPEWTMSDKNAEPSPSPSLDFDTALELTEDYFRHLYPLPSLAFLHKPTVIGRVRDGTIKEPLRLAICAITSLLLQRTSSRHDLWAQQAEQLLLQQLGCPSVFHLQALILVIRYRVETGQFPTAFMLAALAARTAVALRLNYEHAALSYVAQEARRRLYWALYLLDDYFFRVRLREFELCPEETIHLQLPCREEVWEAGQKCQTGTLQPSPSDDVVAMGLRGAAIRLTSIRRDIMRFNRRVTLGEEASVTIGDRIRQFEQALTHQATLSPQFQYSVSNLLSCGWPSRLVLLHVSYHQCHCDMFRLFLNGSSEAAPTGVLGMMKQQDYISMQAKCLQHAEEITQIIDDFTKYCDTSHLLERDTAVCAFESARILLFGCSQLNLTSTVTLETAIHKARTISLPFITKYFAYSAATRPLREALEHLISTYTYTYTYAVRDHIPIPVISHPGDLGKESSSSSSTTTTIEHAPPSHVPHQAATRQRLSVQSLLLFAADDSAHHHHHNMIDEEKKRGVSNNPNNSSNNNNNAEEARNATTNIASSSPYPYAYPSSYSPSTNLSSTSTSTSTGTTTPSDHHHYQHVSISASVSASASVPVSVSGSGSKMKMAQVVDFHEQQHSHSHAQAGVSATQSQPQQALDTDTDTDTGEKRGLSLSLNNNSPPNLNHVLDARSEAEGLIRSAWMGFRREEPCWGDRDRDRDRCREEQGEEEEEEEEEY
ncbi:hypothetical protein F5Y17DRAFT_51473 [Xylariaceae sp. FL0594]|nr:hypothetical protein F5Y17DRAFT_51473 [Xylariaceae sp. FL0594]